MTTKSDGVLCGAQRPNQPQGVTCGEPAGFGTSHVGIGRCKFHGGSSPTHVKSAQLELARRECDRLGVEVEIDPAEALIRAVWRAQGNLVYYETQVNTLDGVTTTEYGPVGASKEVAHPLVILYHEAERWAANVAVSALRAGVDERRLQMAERDAADVFRAVSDALIRMGLSERFGEFRELFANAINEQRQLSGGIGATSPTD
jgi:hypothetical protein